MQCPNEGLEMRPVKVESHYGQTVVLDQCPGCGGLWFDKFELYTPKQGQAEKIEAPNLDIEALDVAGLRSPSVIDKSVLICPKDHAKLDRFQDPYFPKEIIIERCHICEGFWLNRGEFTKYQNFRRKKQGSQAKSIDQNSPPVVDGIVVDGNIADTPSRDIYDTLGNLGRFLSIPMDSTTGRPLEPDKLSEKDQNAINLILGVLTTVLRFFIRI
jgi:Zn-finger nucleic acid-binding protein